MLDDSREETARVLRRLKDLPGLSPNQRRCIEGLETASWPNDLAALAELWPTSPELVEQYLDVMVEALHGFPEQVETGSSSSAGGVRASTAPAWSRVAPGPRAG